MSIVALRNIYDGGLDDLHKRMKSKNITVLQLRARSGPDVEIVVGDKCKQALLDINLQWHAFMRAHWPSPPEDLLLNLISQMFGCPPSNMHTMQAILDEMCNLGRQNPSKLVSAFANQMRLHESIGQSSRYLFQTWRLYIESMVGV
jgi:hypothetical protein